MTTIETGERPAGIMPRAKPTFVLLRFPDIMAATDDDPHVADVLTEVPADATAAEIDARIEETIYFNNGLWLGGARRRRTPKLAEAVRVAQEQVTIYGNQAQSTQEA